MTEAERVKAFEPARAVCAPQTCRVSEAAYSGLCWVRDGDTAYCYERGGYCRGCHHPPVFVGNEERHRDVMFRIRRTLAP